MFQSLPDRVFPSITNLATSWFGCSLFYLESLISQRLAFIYVPWFFDHFQQAFKLRGRNSWRVIHKDILHEFLIFLFTIRVDQPCFIKTAYTYEHAHTYPQRYIQLLNTHHSKGTSYCNISPSLLENFLKVILEEVKNKNCKRWKWLNKDLVKVKQIQNFNDHN